jgi:hypothetical protein
VSEGAVNGMNGPATSNKQVIGWLVTIVVLLVQFAILGRISTIDDRTVDIKSDVAALKSFRADDKGQLDMNTGEIRDIRNAFDASQQKRINELGQDLKTKQFALKHEREHSDNEVRALTNDLVDKATGVDP